MSVVRAAGRVAGDATAVLRQEGRMRVTRGEHVVGLGWVWNGRGMECGIWPEVYVRRIWLCRWSGGRHGSLVRSRR